MGIYIHIYVTDTDDKLSSVVTIVDSGSNFYDCQRDNRQKVCRENTMKSEAVKEICLAKFTVDDVINGIISTSGSFLAEVISKCAYDSRALGTIEGRSEYGAE